jgi:hypothetical protein
MRKSELEAWVLSVIDQVASGQPNEDARVELKREWPEPSKAARRIAGHANAAGGDLILWIIGLDQAAGVVGVNDLDVAGWFYKVKAEFSELAPALSLDLNVPAGGGKTVVALLFETDRAPFVVKNPSYGMKDGGPVQLEVPWREGTGVRSATRSDLLRLLSPLELLPSFEVIEGELKMKLPSKEGSRRPTWWVLLRLYIVPQEEPVVIPFHRCRGTVRIGKAGVEASFSRVLLYPANKVFGRLGRGHHARSPTILESNDELIVDGPGMMKIEASSQPGEPIDALPLDAARVTIEIFPAHTERPAIVSADFQYLTLKDDEHVWFLMSSKAKS